MSRQMSSSRRTHHHNSFNPRFNSSGHYRRRGLMGGGGYYGRRRYGPWGYYGYGGFGLALVGFIFLIPIVFILNPILGVIAIVAILIYVSRKDQRKTRGTPSPNQYVSQSQRNTISSPKQVSTKPVTSSAGYQQRPKAKSCKVCGAGLLTDSKFCSECGTTT